VSSRVRPLVDKTAAQAPILSGRTQSEADRWLLQTHQRERNAALSLQALQRIERCVETPNSAAMHQLLLV
jgi:hypothetical protein